jgi:hypothetical protein
MLMTKQGVEWSDCTSGASEKPYTYTSYIWFGYIPYRKFTFVRILESNVRSVSVRGSVRKTEAIQWTRFD